jgi:hypothetical protein
MISSILWDMTPFSPLKVNRRFGGMCRLQLHGRRINQARSYREAGFACYLLHAGFLLGCLLDPEDGGDMDFRKAYYL